MSIRYDWLISFFFDYRWQQQNRFEFSMFHCSTACVSFFFFSLTAWLLSSSSTCGWLDWALGLTMCWTTTNDGWNVLSIRSSNKFLLCYFSFGSTTVVMAPLSFSNSLVFKCCSIIRLIFFFDFHMSTTRSIRLPCLTVWWEVFFFSFDWAKHMVSYFSLLLLVWTGLSGSSIFVYFFFFSSSRPSFFFQTICRVDLIVTGVLVLIAERWRLEHLLLGMRLNVKRTKHSMAAGMVCHWRHVWYTTAIRVSARFDCYTCEV